MEFRACSNNVRHTWCAPSVFLRDGKFFDGAGGILRLCKFSLKMRLDILLLRTHGVHFLFCCVMEKSWLRQVQFRACTLILENYIGDCFVTHAWYALFFFLHDEKFLVEAGGILSLCNYS